jgi:cytoskeletal protein CcmA (bactofilin family)
MRDFDGKFDGPFTVANDLRLRGMIAGDATVASGVTLELHGMVTGDLFVEDGATVFIRGTVSGSVTNRGRVEVKGRIGGSLHDVDSGQSVVDPDAQIHDEHD